MTTAKQELFKLLKEGLDSAQVGTTLEIASKNLLPAIIEKGLKAGKTVYYKNQIIWIEHVEVVRLDVQKASDMYTWNKSGNRVLNDKFKVTKDSKTNLILTREHLGTCYRKF